MRLMKCIDFIVSENAGFNFHALVRWDHPEIAWEVENSDALYRNKSGENMGKDYVSSIFSISMRYYVIS